ncbi:hypothetical protein ACFL52_00940 [Candidatus Margulisiibacteriota bacterium]
MNYKKILWIFLLFFIVAVLISCGRVVDQSSSSSGSIPSPSTETYVEDGQTGGTFSSSDGNFSVVIPSGSMPAALRANPTVSQTSIDSSYVLLSTETAVSNSYDLNLSSTENFITTQAVQVTLAFTSSSVPVAYLSDEYVYAKVYDPNTEALFPVMGTISGSNLVLDLKGLPKRAVFTVVYDSTLRSVYSTNSGLSIQATQTGTWETNYWKGYYYYLDDNIRSTVASILGVDKASLTQAQIADVIKARIGDNAAAAGTIYQNAGFRQPNLKVWPAATGEKFYKIIVHHLGSKYFSGNPLNDSDLREFSFGQMYINPFRLDDAVGSSLGSVKASVAHEMFHAIQQGYDFSCADKMKAVMEGGATSYGVTIDQGATEPQVRSALNSEMKRLTTYLLCAGIDSVAYDYAHQDFFAYVGRAYGSDSLTYLKDMYEQLKSDIDAAVSSGTTSARTYPSRVLQLESINQAFTSQFGSDLPTIYFDFVKQRAMEHNADSQLRSGEPSTMTLNTDLFYTGGYKTHTVDPDTLDDNPLEDSFSIVDPLSSRAIKISASKIVDDVDAYLTITPSWGVLGTTLKAILYRNGVGTELTSSALISDFGASADDELIILLSNVNYENIMNTISYRLGPTPGVTGVDTFEATVTIEGTGYTFSPQSIKGTFGTYSGNVERSGLPAAYASEGATYTDTSSELITILTNPSAISSSGGSYTLNEVDQVFDNSNGDANLNYTTPSITNVDDGSQVVFESTGGTITFTSYSTSSGDRMTGTFSAQVSGDRTTDQAGTTTVTLTGTITGTFDVALKD